MNLTIFAAASPAGRFLVAKALARGMQVTAFDRQIDTLIDRDNRDDHLIAVKGYVFDAGDVRDALKKADAVVSLLGGGTDGVDKTRSLGTRNIVQQMEKAGVKRIVALAGSAILDSGEEGVLVMDTPDFPHEMMPVALEYLAVYQLLRESSLDWTLVCPGQVLQDAGNGPYITSADHAPAPDNGRIGAEDLADFIIDEIVNGKYTGHRAGISRL